MATQQTTQYQPQPLSAPTGQGQQNAQYQPQSLSTGRVQQIQSPQSQQQQAYQTQTTTMMTQQPGMRMTTGAVVGQTYGGCQSNAKCVAYIDIVVSLIECIFLIAGLVIIFGAIAEAQRRAERLNLTYSVSILVIAIIFFGILAAILSIIDVIIACRLLTATNPVTSRVEAISYASCWRCYNIFLIILTLLRSAVSVYRQDIGGWGFIWFVLRIIFVVTVHQYIQELERGGGMMGVAMGGVGVQQVSTTTTLPSAGNMQYQQPNQYNQYQQRQNNQYQQQQSYQYNQYQQQQPSQYQFQQQQQSQYQQPQQYR